MRLGIVGGGGGLTASAALPPSFKMEIPMAEQTEDSDATAPSFWSWDGAGCAHAEEARPKPRRRGEKNIAEERSGGDVQNEEEGQKKLWELHPRLL
jgi:hypothetical protein